MIRLSANISKKVPIQGVDFSSQQYGAAMEIEISDADKADAIKARIGQLYGLLSQAIDQQITAGLKLAPASVQVQLAPALQPPVTNRVAAHTTQNNSGNGHNGGNGRKTTATTAQCRAIFAICKSLNLDMNAVLANYNVTDASQLPVKVASQLIDSLKSRQGAAQQPAQ